MTLKYNRENKKSKFEVLLSPPDYTFGPKLLCYITMKSTCNMMNFLKFGL